MFDNYVSNTQWHINFTLICSFVEGVASAAVASSALCILMQIFPGHESSITAWTEMGFGLGYMLGRIRDKLTYLLLVPYVYSTTVRMSKVTNWVHVQ